MNEKTQFQPDLEVFRNWLESQEKSSATILKYLRDVAAFRTFASAWPADRETVLAYKAYLVEQGYAPSSINSMLAAINSYLDFAGYSSAKVKYLRMQKKTYSTAEKELTRAEYLRLLKASKNQPQLNLLLQTICGTGIRVSELKYFTVEATRRGEVAIRCKGKNRSILMPGKLRRLLLDFARSNDIRTGAIFCTRTGKPLDRSNIWKRMKSLCIQASVAPQKVFPHNLRKLFARTFYGIEKDIAKLADILGHSSIETTRIYIMTTGLEHRRQLERMHLII